MGIRAAVLESDEREVGRDELEDAAGEGNAIGRFLGVPKLLSLDPSTFTRLTLGVGDDLSGFTRLTLTIGDDRPRPLVCKFSAFELTGFAADGDVGFDVKVD